MLWHPRWGTGSCQTPFPGVRGVPLTPGYPLRHRWWKNVQEHWEDAQKESSRKYTPPMGRDDMVSDEQAAIAALFG